jgi:hypothetical protein
MLLIAVQIELYNRYRSISLDQLAGAWIDFPISIDSVGLDSSGIGVDSGEGGVVITVGSVEGTTVFSVG